MRHSKKAFVMLVKVAIFITILIYFYKFNRFKKLHTKKLDTRIVPNESFIFQEISKEMPYLPIEDLNNIDNENRNLNQTCAWYPSFLDIQIHNDYWQEFQNLNISYYIYGAYLDKRVSVVKDEPMLRILTMIHFISPQDEDYPKTYCQLWYKEQKEPIIVPAKNIHRLWNYAWSHYSEDNYAHFISCNLPKEHQDWIPRTVSLVASPCDNSTNNVRVIYFPLKDPEIKQEFAVCIKGLDYPYNDITHRLVEYIETMRSLGAKKIFLYNLQIHSNTTKVLQYYQKSGYLEYLPFSLSFKVGNLPKYRHMLMAKNLWGYTLHEVINYNDCFYRNMYHYQYVAVVDIDEILMPLVNFSSWHDLVQFGNKISLKLSKKFASYCFRCVYFPHYSENSSYTPEFSENFYMLQHIKRVRVHMDVHWATKCLHNTDYVIGLHNHFAFHIIPNVSYHYSFKPHQAQLQHYRDPYNKETLNDTVIDQSLWLFKDEILLRSLKVLKELQVYD